MHIMSQHEGIRYSCDQCSYKAARKGYLKIHFESEHEGICFTCDQCRYKAIRKYYPNHHMKSMHEVVIRGNLSQHIATEHKLITYNC